MAHVGLCGTDLHIVHGHMDARVSRPLAFGHEMERHHRRGRHGCRGMERWRPGHRDAAGLGRYVSCMPGRPPAHLPEPRLHRHRLPGSPPGVLGRASVHARAVAATAISLQAAALVEPVAVAVHDVRRSELRAGDKTVVLGGGPIGVLIATVARSESADVAVVELDPGRRELIAGLGLEALDPREVDLPTWVEAWTGGAGADVVFEVSGAAAAVLSATDLAKVRGTIVVVAIHPTPREVNLQRVFWRELRILGARVYERRDFERAVELVDDGTIPSDALITRTVPLAETAAAIHDLAEGKAMKILVDVQGGAA